MNHTPMEVMLDEQVEKLKQENAQLEELLESTHNVMVQRGERAIVLEAENTALKDFVLWLTPCADDMPEYPPYKLIGEKAKALLTEQE